MESQVFTFSLVVTGLDIDDDAQIDALYTAGCEDVMVEARADQAIVTFWRTAPWAEIALWAAVMNLLEAVPGIEVLRVDDDLVNATDIAERIDRTPENVRQMASGSRGAGAFPAPAGVVGNGIKVWRWAEVHPWLAEQGLVEGECPLPAEVIVDANARLAHQLGPRDLPKMLMQVLKARPREGSGALGYASHPVAQRFVEIKRLDVVPRAEHLFDQIDLAAVSRGAYHLWLAPPTSTATDDPRADTVVAM